MSLLRASRFSSLMRASARLGPRGLTLLGLVAASAGCEPPPPLPPSDAGMRDVPARDVPEADAPILDAPAIDGEAVDGGPPGCTTDGAEVFELGSDLGGSERVVGLAAGATEWGLSWTQQVGGFSEVHVASIAATGEPHVEQLTSLGAIQRDGAVVASEDGWLVGYVGSHDGGFEVYVQALASDLSTRGAARRLTTNALLDAAPTLTALPTGGFLAAWSEVDTRGVAMTRLLGADGAPTAAARAVTAAGNSVERATLATRSAGAVLVWGDSAAIPSVARVLALDAVGASSGAPVSASSEGNIDGSADVTLDATGGAMVFGALVGGVRAEVRIRLLDGTGTPIEAEGVATASAGRDASIAAFGGGYVVAYRAAGDTTPIRLASLDAQGRFVSEIDVAADGAPTGGRTTVRVTGEGRILVAWSDLVGGVSRIRAARVRCE